MDILTINLAVAAANAVVATLLYFGAGYRHHIQHSWPGKQQANIYRLYFHLSWLAFAVAAAFTLYIKSIQ